MEHPVSLEVEAEVHCVAAYCVRVVGVSRVRVCMPFSVEWHLPVYWSMADSAVGQFSELNLATEPLIQHSSPGTMHISRSPDIPGQKHIERRRHGVWLCAQHISRTGRDNAGMK